MKLSIPVSVPPTLDYQVDRLLEPSRILVLHLVHLLVQLPTQSHTKLKTYKCGSIHDRFKC